MAIKYSLSVFPVNPTDEKQGKKIFARAQYSEIVDLPMLARHIQEHGSPFTRDVIVGVLTAAVDCLREQLILGNKVDFGDLGSFYVALRSEGVEKAEDFNPHAHIKSVDPHWEPSVYFGNLKDDPALKWEYTLTRKEMAEAKKEAKKEATDSVVPGTTPEGPGTGNPGGGSGSGTPGTGGGDGGDDLS